MNACLFILISLRRFELPVEPAGGDAPGSQQRESLWVADLSMPSAKVTTSADDQANHLDEAIRAIAIAQVKGQLSSQPSSAF